VWHEVSSLANRALAKIRYLQRVLFKPRQLPLRSKCVSPQSHALLYAAPVLKTACRNSRTWQQSKGATTVIAPRAVKTVQPSGADAAGYRFEANSELFALRVEGMSTFASDIINVTRSCRQPGCRHWQYGGPHKSQCISQLSAHALLAGANRLVIATRRLALCYPHSPLVSTLVPKHLHTTLAPPHGHRIAEARLMATFRHTYSTSAEASR